MLVVPESTSLVDQTLTLFYLFIYSFITKLTAGTNMVLSKYRNTARYICIMIFITIYSSDANI
jgi:hypothetical protein